MRQMHLGIMVYPTGQHISAWRLPEAEPRASSENLKQQIWIAQTAERGKFDMLFFADALSTGPNYHPSTVVRLEPVTLLCALAMATTHIGLAATATTTYTEPYNLARLFGSLDHISGGRAAWNVITSSLAGTADNFGRVHPPHDERYTIALEFIDVVKGLWDSWDDGAIVIDKQTGVYADPAGMHPLNHHGQYFNVQGALNLSRPPQGYPVIIQAGSSEAGRDVAAQVAEVIFTVHEDKGAAKAFVDDIRARAHRFGRDPAGVKIMPGVCPIIAENEQAARRKFSEMAEFQDPKVALKVLSDRLGVPLRRLRPRRAAPRPAAVRRHARPRRHPYRHGPPRQPDPAPTPRPRRRRHGPPHAVRLPGADRRRPGRLVHRWRRRRLQPDAVFLSHRPG